MNEAVAVLRDPATIRARCANIAASVAAGRSPWFVLHEARLEQAAQQVVELTRQRYPALRIPYHSRWRHFEAGGIDRAALLSQRLEGLDAAEQARCRIDLSVVSVLLDAGAGADWRYREPGSDAVYQRSEGLAVASFQAFVSGAFSSDAAQPLRVDAQALQAVDAEALAAWFQADASNPLVGIDGRAVLLQRLGAVLAAAPAVFGAPGRPGGLFDRLAGDARGELPAAALLGALLRHFSSIWLSDNRLGGEPLGDVWRHPRAGGEGESAGWVPFHKLSQWLAYSLFEPFEWAGVRIAGRDALTALPEYRNGGLLIDSGVLEPRDARLTDNDWTPGDVPIVEWRALTVHLLDRLAERVRAMLGVDAAQLPLACVLEGGTWAAGRALAADLRSGLPPLRVVSDGTVF